jgi:glycosyltransferase involved in cell wall biosynthesis
MTDLDKPLVSVGMITYNHEKYVAQAIESVLMQKTDFKYELVIGEDYSTDGTRTIVCAYGERFPGLIRTILPEHNQGFHINANVTLEACRGKYIAVLEGDDYWTDPTKLQKQVDFLEQNPGFAICCHAVNFVYEDGQPSRIGGYLAPKRNKYILRDLCILNFIATASTVYRNNLFEGFPLWYYEMAMGDWILHILNAEHGDIWFMDETMATYRVHSEGYWTGMAAIEKKKKIIKAIDRVNEYLEYKYNKEMMSTRYIYMQGITSLYEKQHDIKNARRYFIDSLKYFRFFSSYPKMKSVKMFAKLYIPFWGKLAGLRNILTPKDGNFI